MESVKEFLVWGFGLDENGKRDDVETFLHRDAPSFNKKSSVEQIKRKNMKFKKTIKKLRKKAENEKDEFHRGAPSHMGPTVKNKFFQIVTELLTKHDYPDVALEEQLRRGFTYDGPIAGTGVYRKISGEEMEERMTRAEKEMGKREKAKGQFTKKSLRKNPPKWMSQAQHKRMWVEFKETREKMGCFEEIEESELKETPVYSFGVEQKNKLRPCMDFSLRNLCSFSGEKLSMPSFSKVGAMTRTLMTFGASLLFPLFQVRSNLKRDVDNEKLKRNVVEMRTDIDQFVEESFNAMADGEKVKEKEKKETGKQKSELDREHPFCPHISKLDFSKYYYQLQPNSCNNNIICYWCPRELDQESKGVGKGGGEQTEAEYFKSTNEKGESVEGRYRYFRSSCLLFGSLHSVYGALRLSCALSFILDREGLITTDIYVDDSIVQSRPQCEDDDSDAVKFFYQSIGLTLSVGPGKEEHSNQGDIEILGVGARRKGKDEEEVNGLGDKGQEGEWEFFMSEERTKYAVDIIEEGIRQLRSKKLRFEHLEGALGYLNFFFSIDPNRSGKNNIQAAYSYIKNENHFAHVMKSPEERACLIKVLNQLKVLVQSQDGLILDRGNLERPVRHIYSDAALEEVDGELRFADMGGMCPRTKTAWRCRVEFAKHVPKKHIPRCKDIHLWELMAVLINVRAYVHGDFGVIEESQGAREKNEIVVSHIDNLGGSFSLVKGVSKHQLSTSVCQFIHRCTRRVFSYYVWIFGGRNPADAPSRMVKGEKTVDKKIVNFIRRLGVHFTHEINPSEAIPWVEFDEIEKETQFTGKPGEEPIIEVFHKKKKHSKSNRHRPSTVTSSSSTTSTAVKPGKIARCGL